MDKEHHPRSYNTRRAGAVLGGILPSSLSTALYRNGHYCGIKPVKLPNGRLLWPAAEIDALAAGARADEAPDLGARLASGRREALARSAAAEAGKAGNSSMPPVTPCSPGQGGFIAVHVTLVLATVGSIITCLAAVAVRGL